jgi:hypothetical protein
MADTDIITGEVVKGIPEITSEAEYKELDEGHQFISDGRVYTKGRKQRSIPRKKQPYEWGMQDEFVNMMLAGYGDEIYGALDWLAAAIVPDNAFGIARGPDPTLAEAQERVHQAQLQYRETNPIAATTAQVMGGLMPTAVAAKAGMALTKALPQLKIIPKYLRGVGGAALQAGVTASGEADPGERLERAESGAKAGAIISATMQPVSAMGGFITKTIGGRINPQKSARNIVNNAILQSNVTRTETATAEELAQLPAEIRNLPPHLRRTARRLGQLGGDATIADAARGGAVRTVANVAAAMAGPGSERAEGLLSERGAGEGVRIVQAIDDTLSAAYGDPKEISAGLMRSAQPAYDAAFGITRNDQEKIDYAAPRTVNQDLMNANIVRILSTPMGKKAFNAAIVQMENEHGWDAKTGAEATRILNQLVSRATKDSRGRIIGIPDNAPGLSLEFLDKVKIQLQQQGESLADRGKRTDSRSAKQLSANLIKELDDLDATEGMYEVARGVAQSNILLKKAYLKGVEAFGPKGSVKAIEKLMKDYTPGQRAMFQAGAASFLRNMVLKKPERGGAAQAVFGNKLIMNKIAAIIDDKDDLAAFRKAIAQEKTYALTQRRVLGGGGPQAASAGQGRDAIGTAFALGGSKLPGSNPLIVAGLFRRLGQQLMGAETNDEVVKILLTRDPDENRQYLAALSQLPTDPEVLRLRQLVERAVAQQFETKRERYQVPTGQGRYRLKDFERSMTDPTYPGRMVSQAGSALANALRNFPGMGQKGD